MMKIPKMIFSFQFQFYNKIPRAEKNTKDGFVST